MPDWYERRHELESGQVFRDYEGEKVKLDRRVPGDGTQWYVATWNIGYFVNDNNYANPSWCYDDTRIEPGDLRERMYELE